MSVIPLVTSDVPLEDFWVGYLGDTFFKAMVLSSYINGEKLFLLFQSNKVKV